MNYYNPGYPYNPYMNQPMQFQPQPTQIQPQLNGKVVDSADVVRATEVPIGGYGIFPKADLSEVYVKSWNNNGTTSVITFRPAETSPEAPQNQIIERLNALEEKIDKLVQSGMTAAAAKKEVKGSDY